MVQPWAQKKSRKPRAVAVTLAYAFDAKAQPTGDLHLAVEQPGRYALTVNGTAVGTDAECGWWTDRSLRRVRIDPSLLRVGTNEITLACDYDENHPGLEIVYLLGAFGTRVRGTDVAVTAAPTSLELGDWVGQGLAFYSGSVGYVRRVRPKLSRGQRLFVRVPEYRGVAVRVLVDGREAGIIGWQPNEVDITDFLGDGPVNLCLEVVGHRRNSHGPLHHAEKWPTWTGPGQFVTSGEEWVDGYQLVPCGLMAPPELLVRQ